ncbi:MAG: hypothetical protein HRU09_07835 [Oligoflexales bacterium]|nr:hypothetical protein [Oligoflexales bacterium]
MIKIFFLTLVLFSAVTIGFVYHSNAGLNGQKLEYNAQLQSLLLQGLKYEQAQELLAKKGIRADNPEIKKDFMSFMNHAVNTVNQQLPKMLK